MNETILYCRGARNFMFVAWKTFNHIGYINKWISVLYLIYRVKTPYSPCRRIRHWGIELKMRTFYSYKALDFQWDKVLYLSLQSFLSQAFTPLQILEAPRQLYYKLMRDCLLSLIGFLQTWFTTFDFCFTILGSFLSK